jgi:hypothetical protein
MVVVLCVNVTRLEPATPVRGQDGVRDLVAYLRQHVGKNDIVCVPPIVNPGYVSIEKAGLAYYGFKPMHDVQAVLVTKSGGLVYPPAKKGTRYIVSLSATKLDSCRNDLIARNVHFSEVAFDRAKLTRLMLYADMQ